MPKYVRHKGTGNVFPFETHGHLIGTSDRHEVYWEGEDAPPKEPVVKDQSAGASGEGDGKDERMEQIIEAVKQVDPENYTNATANRPAMPKIASVVALTGFKVTGEEIAKAMELIKG